MCCGQASKAGTIQLILLSFYASLSCVSFAEGLKYGLFAYSLAYSQPKCISPAKSKGAYINPKSSGHGKTSWSNYGFEYHWENGCLWNLSEADLISHLLLFHLSSRGSKWTFWMRKHAQSRPSKFIWIFCLCPLSMRKLGGLLHIFRYGLRSLMCLIILHV